jgi:hypothetical protein
MFVGWEGVGICSYLLVNFWYTRIAANQSSISALLTNRVGDCFLTIGMFAILWSFGNCKKMLKENSSLYNLTNRIVRKINNLTSGQVRQKSDVPLHTYTNLGAYLAGLIEADGYIGVHDKNSKSKKYRPKIIVVFSLADKPLAEKLATITQAGKVLAKPNAGHVLWQIIAKKEVLKLINLINGHMRTPKIEALHRAIRWINENDHCSIDCLDLDLSPIDSNSWLAGFTDGDGNFSISLIDRKKSGGGSRKVMQTFFRIELKQEYSREVTDKQGGNSYFNILTKISAFFTVNLYTRTRISKDKVYYAFMVVSHSSRSHEIVRSYFDRFPLYSSKYLAYKDWCTVQDLVKEPGGLTLERVEKIKTIKAQFNSKRKVFDFSHLDKLTF